MGSNQKGLIFGKIALKKGFISKGDLEECIQRQDELAEKEGETPSIKSILLDAGYVTEEQINQIEQVREKVTQKNKITGYELHEKLGEGATGAVYKATQLSLDRPVAIKVLYPSIIEDEAFLDRFYREARTVAKLNHEGIIQGIDVGEENGLYYFVMEYVEGDTLDEIIDEKGKISEQRTQDIGLQVARALKHAQDNGLIHRDVKPENIMINREGIAKLCDLGLAKKMGNEDSSVTQMGVTIGTPHYMSPEQATGENLDIRTDIYALGASLYHAVTGEVPFDADAAASVMTKHVTEELEPPGKKKPYVSDRFNAVIMKMMAKDVDDRYQSPDELIVDLERIQEGKDPEHATVERVPSRPKSSGRRFSRGQEPSLLDRIVNWPVIAGCLLFLFAGYVAYSNMNSTRSTTVKNQQKKNRKQPLKLSKSGKDSSNSDDRQTKNSGEKPDSTEERETTGDDSPESEEQDQEEQQNGTDNQKEIYNNLKKTVNNFEGDQEKVLSINSRMTTLLKKTSDKQLKQKIQTLRKEFLEQQAERYYEDRIGKTPSGNALQELVEVHRKLNKFPSHYKNTSVWKRVRKQKKSIRETVRNRLNEMKDQLRTRIENQSFSEEGGEFRTLEKMSSGKLAGKLIGDWEKLRKKYLREKSRWQRNKLVKSQNLFRTFKRKFQQLYLLSKKSILRISDQQAIDLINSYSKRISIESVQKEVEAYRTDVDHLGHYRDLLKNGLTDMVANGERMDISNKRAGRKGQLVELDGHVLKIKRKKEVYRRPLTSFDISKRISFANGNNKNETGARDAFAFGLAGYYSGKKGLARSWLERVSESDLNRVNHYLDDLERRTFSPRERKALSLLNSLRTARNAGMELAKARIISELNFYRDTAPYKTNREEIHKDLQELPYDPLEFIRYEKSLEKRKKTKQMLSLFTDWYNCEVGRGSGIGSIYLSYDFSKRNQVSDWVNTNPSDLNVTFEKNEEAVRFFGEGLLLHEIVFSGRADLQARVDMKDRIKNVGGLVMWSRNRGYRGMVNWNPLGTSADYPNVGSTVLQKLQLPSEKGNPDFSNTRIQNLSRVAQGKLPVKASGRIGIRRRGKTLRLTLDGQKISSARDEQFTRGKTGLVFEKERGKIREITITGHPNWKWFKQELERRNLSNEISASGSYDGPLSFQDVEVGGVAFAINMGGEAFQKKNGSFQADPYASGSLNSEIGKVVGLKNPPQDRVIDQIYRTQRVGTDLTYVFPLANGRYDVTLYLIENKWKKPGKRLFDASLQMKQVLTNFDINAETGGPNIGIKKTFKNLSVTDERLYLDLKGVQREENIANAIIAGVSITRTGKFDRTPIDRDSENSSNESDGAIDSSDASNENDEESENPTEEEQG